MNSPLSDPKISKYSTRGHAGSSSHSNSLEKMAGNSVGSPGTSRIDIGPHNAPTSGRKTYPSVKP